jgi:DNA-binding transcriptional ArsR family regulator
MRLSQGEATVGELAAPFAMTKPAISKHLRVLTKAGLISQRRDAQRRPCRIVGAPLREVAMWAEQFRQNWEDSHRRLDAFLADSTPRTADRST